MTRRFGVAIAGAAFLLAVAAVAGFLLTRGGDRRSYSAADVRAVFGSVGLPLTHSVVRGTEAVLGPTDESFTVIVVKSDTHAREYYKPYALMKSPDTFQLLAGNVIVESDASNSNTPLPGATRAKIRSAITRLRAQPNSG